MTGIRKRVTIGFLSIVALLFFSGLVSLFELSHMSNDIEAILDSSRKSIEMSKNMLDAIHNNERSVTYYTVLRDSLYADSCRTSLADFDSLLRQARSDVSAEAQSRFDSLDLYTRPSPQCSTTTPSRASYRSTVAAGTTPNMPRSMTA